MVGRKIQRLEVVIVRLNLWTLLYGISKIAKHSDHFVHGFDDRMLGAKRTANAGKSDVEAAGGRFSPARIKSRIPRLRAPNRAALRAGFAQDALRSRTDYLLDFRFELIDALSSSALRIFGRSFEPCLIDLSQETVRARHPTVTKYLPLGLAVDRFRLRCKRRQKLLCRFLQSSGREILKLGNCVLRFFFRTHANALSSQAPPDPRQR